MKRITPDYISSRHASLARLMYAVGLMPDSFTYYEARFQYRDPWATGGYPHIIVICSVKEINYIRSPIPIFVMYP